MSHFSAIKTKIRNKPELQQALELLQYNVEEDQESDPVEEEEVA